MIRSSVIVVMAIFLIAGNPSAASTAQKKIFSIFWTECEEVCAGLKDYIKSTGLDAELIIREVGRDKTKLPQLVDEAKNLKVDVVTTWGTTATLGIVGTLAEVGNSRYLNDIPVVFTLVSDPVRSRIIESYESTGRANITGTRNRVPEAMNVGIMRKIKPTFKRLGIIFNKNEKNSVIKVKEIAELQDQLDFKLIALELDYDESGNPIASSISARVADMAEQNVDFIYLGSSVFLEDHMDTFTDSAVNNGIPVLSPYENLVREAQAYMSVAARDYDVGLLAGEQITAILVEGEKPGDIPVKSVNNYAYVINMRTAQKIKLYPPVDILQIAEIVK